MELAELVSFYKEYRKSLKVGHININSVRHKHGPLYEALTNNLLDLLFIQESKLDNSFPNAQFNIPGYKLYRNDRTSHMGGIMAYMRDDIIQRRCPELEQMECDSGRVECLALEICISSSKWLYCSIYKQPQVSDACFKVFMDNFICNNQSAYTTQMWLLLVTLMSIW